MLDSRPHFVILAALRQSFQFKLFECKRLKHLHRTIDVSAEIWNHAVALHRRYYKLFKKSLPESKLKSHLAKLRNTTKSHWKAVGSQSVQDIVERLYSGWEAFFKKDIKRPPTFVNGGTIVPSRSSNADTKFLDMGASRFLAGTIGLTKAAH